MFVILFVALETLFLAQLGKFISKSHLENGQSIAIYCQQFVELAMSHLEKLTKARRLLYCSHLAGCICFQKLSLTKTATADFHSKFIFINFVPSFLFFLGLPLFCLIQKQERGEGEKIL